MCSKCSSAWFAATSGHQPAQSLQPKLPQQPAIAAQAQRESEAPPPKHATRSAPRPRFQFRPLPTATTTSDLRMHDHATTHGQHQTATGSDGRPEHCLHSFHQFIHCTFVQVDQSVESLGRCQRKRHRRPQTSTFLFLAGAERVHVHLISLAPDDFRINIFLAGQRCLQHEQQQQLIHIQ